MRIPAIFQTKVEASLDAFDRMSSEGKAVAQELGIGVMNIVTLGMDLDRKKRITGTDLPKMFGLIDAKYGDFRTVVAEKLGLIEDDFEGNTPTEVGRFMEPFLLSQIFIRHEHVFRQMKSLHPDKQIWVTLNEHHVHSERLLGASTDVMIYMDDEPIAVFEMKHTASAWDEAPDKVIVQCQAQMMCTGLDRVGVIALTGGNREIKEWVIEADKDWQDRITNAVIQAEAIIAVGHMPDVAIKPEPKKKTGTKQLVPLPEDIALAMELSQRLKTIEECEAWISENKPKLAAKVKADEAMAFSSIGYRAYAYEKSYGGFSESAYNKNAVKLLLKQIPEEKKQEIAGMLEDLERAHTKPSSTTTIFAFAKMNESK